MQRFEGTVTSVKTPQTVAVEIVFFAKHPKYNKVLKKTTKLLAHNEIDGVKEGDKVAVIKSRPYSKLKHFKVSEVLK